MTMHPSTEGPESEDRAPEHSAAEGVQESAAPDWEAFYRDYRKPGYIEGFEITTKLGGGMFGLVFRARRMSIGKDYAIKFLKVDDGEVRRAVLSELEQVKYFAQIDHPNLVSIEDRGEVNGIPFLVMAFAGTETLRDKMTTIGLAEGNALTKDEKDELLRAFLQCSRGLHALHERSLVHFDIKPANVFMKGGVARLGDYGLSKLVTHSRGSLSMGRGTPYYMAPEMLKRRGDVRSDIYSLGVMLYEILCGKVPFTGDSEWEVLRQHENVQPALPGHLTAIERTVLKGCLAKDPELRFQSVDQMLAAFGSLSRLDAVPVVATAASVAAAPPPLTSCVPPPLPTSTSATVAPPLPRKRTREMARKKRRSGMNIGFLGLFAAVLGVMLVLFLWVGSSSHGPRRAPQVTPAPRTIKEAAHQYAAEVLVNARRDAQRNRPRRLQPLNLDRVEVPDDFLSYLEFIDPLAGSPRFMPALAARVERLGRPALVAAVAMLQKLDYEDGFDCRRAANLHLLLAQMTGIKTLVLDVSGRQPSAQETCMFHAVAGGWRVIVERYATDDGTFRELARGSRAIAVPAEAVSPR